MRANEFIKESYVNVWTPEQKMSLIDEIMPLLHKSYETVKGGLGNIDPENLVNTPGLWKLVRRGGKIIAGKLYRDFKGRKTRLTLHDGSREARDAVQDIMQVDMDRNRSWTEASGAVEHLLLKKGGKPRPNVEAPMILKRPGSQFSFEDPETGENDGIHYWRDVGSGNVKRLVIIGNVK